LRLTIFVWPVQHAIELYVSYEEENIFNVAEAGVEGGAVCLVVDHRRGVEQQSELEQVSHPIDLLHKDTMNCPGKAMKISHLNQTK